MKFRQQHSDSVFYYTDGSVADGKSASAVVSANYQKRNRINDDHSIFTAELIAIHGALRHIMKTSTQKHIICSDSASALKAIKHKTQEEHNIVYRIKKALIKEQKQGKTIKLLWIPGHSRILGNEEADQLAKSALDLPTRNHLALPLQDFSALLRRKFLQFRQFEWDAHNSSYLHRIKPKLGHFFSSKQDSRRKEVVLARLRMGATLLTHGHIMNKQPPPPCYHCHPQTRYTIQHFLLDCTHHAQHRRHITHYIRTHNLPLNLHTLLGDEHPTLINLLFQFLHDTKLITNI